MDFKNSFSLANITEVRTTPPLPWRRAAGYTQQSPRAAEAPSHGRDEGQIRYSFPEDEVALPRSPRSIKMGATTHTRKPPESGLWFISI